jgi:hypothetical protein
MRIETTCENRKELVKSIGEFLARVSTAGVSKL